MVAVTGASGSVAGHSGAVDAAGRVLGRPPRALADVLRGHPERLAHVRG